MRIFTLHSFLLLEGGPAEEMGKQTPGLREFSQAVREREEEVRSLLVEFALLEILFNRGKISGTAAHLLLLNREGSEIAAFAGQSFDALLNLRYPE